MATDDFKHTIDTWIRELENYNLSQLCMKPSGGWSLGQMYFHLIRSTEYYLKQVKECSSSNVNAFEQESAEAVVMFENDAFPDAMIEGPDTYADIPQPRTKEELKNALSYLSKDVAKAKNLIPVSHFTGKTKHPGLGYFSAEKWLQFAEMHWKHHLRQKKRIDDFLSARQR